MFQRVCVTAIVGLAIANSHAETFLVTTAADDGSPGTLRWAIERNNAQPAQPTNANVPLSMAPQTPATPPEATPGQPANPRAPRTQQPKSSGDAWDGTR